MNGRDPFPELAMRPVTAADLAAIVDALGHLSRQSLYQRYFTAVSDPTRLVTTHLALVDHRDHEAFVVLDGPTIVAIAQWDRLAARSDEAEVGSWLPTSGSTVGSAEPWCARWPATRTATVSSRWSPRC